MVRTNLLNEVSTSGRPRWLRVNELPWSRALTYSMLRAGVLQSILLTYPGCVKGLRLIDGDSLDRYLEGLANKEFTPSPCKRGRAWSAKEAKWSRWDICRGMISVCARNRLFVSPTLRISRKQSLKRSAAIVVNHQKSRSHRGLVKSRERFQLGLHRF